MDKRGKGEKEVENRGTRGRKVTGAMKTLLRIKGLSTEGVRGLHEGMLISTLSIIRT